jgi:hypothetical protein
MARAARAPMGKRRRNLARGHFPNASLCCGGSGLTMRAIASGLSQSAPVNTAAAKPINPDPAMIVPLFMPAPVPTPGRSAITDSGPNKGQPRSNRSRQRATTRVRATRAVLPQGQLIGSNVPHLRRKIAGLNPLCTGNCGASRLRSTTKSPRRWGPARVSDGGEREPRGLPQP